MTLNLTIVAPWGIWQCSDHRLTRWPGGGVEDDYSMKSLSLHCMDGTAAITYTGLGKIRNAQISDWLRRCIRGESRTLDETLIYIRERANVRLAKFAKWLNIHHTFSIGAIIGGKPWAIVITNIQPSPPFDANPPMSEFNTAAVELKDKPLVMVAGTKAAICTADWKLLKEVSQKRPRRPEDFRKLLATINKRASKHPIYGKYISSTCSTSYIPPEGRPTQGEIHWWGLQKTNVEMTEPTVLFGIDMTETMEILTRQVNKVSESDSDTIDSEAFDRAFREAADRSIKPED